MKIAATAIAVALLAATPAAAQAPKPLTTKQARKAAKLALDSSLGSLAYRGVGTAATSVSGCRVKARRATCSGRVQGTVTCDVRLRVLLSGTKPASDPNSQILVWADRVGCG